MKTVFNYIKEALVNNKIKTKYKYYPKTKNELIEAIQTELDKNNTNLNCIDTSDITDMSYLFDKTYDIELTEEQEKTLDISKWDVYNVTDMNHMFWHRKQFNCDLSNWDVSNVENMASMFYNCKSFNCDISKWDVSNVKNMSGMFYYCKSFNCDISNWHVSNVTNMANMFVSCERFKSDISNWDVSNVKNMYWMFVGSGLEGNEPSWYKKYI